MFACAAAAGPLAGAHTPAFAQEATTVEDIVVTAQRREERLQDVPIAVTALDANMLQSQGIEGSRELARVTPGLVFSQSSVAPSITVRGIGLRGSSIGDEAVVPVFIDGVYQPFPQSTDFRFNNIERIEVLKGPQGALYGRNATGGAINIVTKDPRGPMHGQASVSYGRFDEGVAKAYVAGGSDTIAGDVSVVLNHMDGYIYDPLRNDYYEGLDNVSVRSKLRFAPTENLTLTLGAFYVHNITSTGAGSRLPEGNSTAARVPGATITRDAYRATLSIAPSTKLLSKGVSGTVVYDANFATLTSVSSWQNSNQKNWVDTDSSPVDIALAFFRPVTKSFYQEVYATSAGDGPFSWIIGGVFFHGKDSYSPNFNIITRPVSLTGVLGAPITTRGIPVIKTNSVAGYAQATYAFTDEWRVTVGGRYTSEEKRMRSIIGVTTFTTIANEATFEKFTPSATLQYRPSDSLNLYVKAGQAFKSGIYNGFAINQLATTPVRPETAWQYEVGMKANPTSRVRFNLSAYYTDYKDLQVNVRDPVTTVVLLTNSGGANIYGLEGEAYWRATDALNVRAGFSLISAKYKNFANAQAFLPQTLNNPTAAEGGPTACVMGTGPLLGGNRAVFCDVSGNDLIRVPKLTANIGGDYTVPLESADIVATANLYYASRSSYDILNRVKEPRVVLLSGELAWRQRDGGLEVALWGENLLDEKYSTTRVVSTTNDSQVLAPPRTYGVRLGYSW